MTSREQTGFLTRHEGRPPRPWRESLLVGGWAMIQWPWLLKSLSGGRLADKLALLDRLGLPENALPHLGSWKADTVFLAQMTAAIEELRPKIVVELGCGASSLIIARALQLNGDGRLYSYDQHAGFVAETRSWLAAHGLHPDLRHAPLVAGRGRRPGGRRWASNWYRLDDLPEAIDLIVIDGPPWTVNPFVRGAAETLFDRLAPGGRLLMDDAARPGERIVAKIWARDWPGIAFRRLPGGTAGTLEGRKAEY